MTTPETRGVLDAIVASCRRAVEVRRRKRPRSVVEQAIARRPAGQAFHDALAAPGIRVIAECKRRSPSRGVLREAYDPAALAADYAAGGACAISVLTEPAFFDGSLDHLRVVRSVVDLPLLRKDFIVDEYQVFEAAEAGADALLLIVAALDDHELRALLQAARGLGLAALVEVHDARDLERALESGAEIIGVNSRDLRTLSVRTATAGEMIGRIPAGRLAVAESGLRTATDLVALARLGYRAFLIGEHLVTASSPGGALASLITEASHLAEAPA